MKDYEDASELMVRDIEKSLSLEAEHGTRRHLAPQAAKHHAE